MKKLTIIIEENDLGESKCTFQSEGFSTLEVMGLVQTLSYDLYKKEIEPNRDLESKENTDVTRQG